ncbi:DnaJ domain-containing protein [Lipomyces arxii]|uniref:DnaJ domain-containing protein n=1 Tax=Lipomyces arxii TaxID=56418 RepID=UPI0034CDF0DD
MANAKEREEVAKKYDFYELIGVNDSAESSEIRRAYRRAALKYHPDKNSGAIAVEKFHALSIANEVLLDDELRREYDNKRGAKKREQERHAAFDLKRRQGKEELERREEKEKRKRKRKEGEGSRNRPKSWTEEKEDELEAKVVRLQAQSAMLCAQRDARLRVRSVK